MKADYKKSLLSGYYRWKNSDITWLDYDRPSINKRRAWANYMRAFGKTLRFLGGNSFTFSCAGWKGNTFHFLTGSTDYYCTREELNALLGSNS